MVCEGLGLTMETVSHQRISDANPTHIITACEETDTCPGCGAGYRVGLSACEYCRRPVRFATDGLVPKDMHGHHAHG